MTAVEITNSRLTFIYGECFVDHLRQKSHPNAAPWDSICYQQTFNQIRGGDRVASNFQFPWRTSRSNSFWSGLLGDSDLSSVSAAQAWDSLVPFRLAHPEAPQVHTDNPDERVFFDCYGYPFGIMLALTVQSPRHANETLNVWESRLRSLVLKNRFSVDTLTGRVPNLPVVRAMDTVLEWYRRYVYGEHAFSVRPLTASYVPITLNAVIQGKGAISNQPVSRQIQDVIHSVTSWSKIPKGGTRIAFKDSCIPVSDRNASLGDAFYYYGRGRTLWRPGLFLERDPSEGPIHTLSCLAHNIVASSVHSEMVRLFAKSRSKFFQISKITKADLENKSARTLSDLYWGINTYRSRNAELIVSDPNSLFDVRNLIKAQEYDDIGDAESWA